LAFNGTYGLVAAGSDMAGNTASADGGIDVTRWNWMFDTKSSIQVTPAIGHSGSIYFATFGSGFYALDSDGQAKWPTKKTLGEISSSPTIGAWNGTDETLYVAATAVGNPTLGASLYAFQGSDGGLTSRLDGDAGTDIEGSLAVTQTTVDGGTAESVAAVFNSGTDGQFVIFRPTDSNANSISYSTNLGALNYPNAVVTDGTSFFFGDNNNRLHQLKLDANTATLSEPTDWPSTFTNTINGLALGGGSSLGYLFGATAGTGNTGSIFSLLTSASPDPSSFPDTTGKDFGLILDDTQHVLFTNSKNKLTRIDATNLNQSQSTSVASSGASTGTPLEGADGRLYVATSVNTNELAVWASNFTQSQAPEWRFPLPAAVNASLSIDCARNTPVATGLGVLYVASSNGQLYSIIVDSHGINTNAPWPKYQHDPRNTGNSSVNLSEFVCP
jgi:hypothetical protein